MFVYTLVVIRMQMNVLAGKGDKKIPSLLLKLLLSFQLFC